MRWEINLYIEVKDGDRWVSLSKPIPSPREEDFYPSSYFRGGTMPLLAVLGHEEAGEKTGIKQIIHPSRGMPEDLSPEIKRADEQQEERTYFHSWFLLKEWMAFDWKRVVHTAQSIQSENQTDYQTEGVTEAQAECLETEDSNEIVKMAEFEKKMNSLLKWGDPEEIRAIYWFINKF